MAGYTQEKFYRVYEDSTGVYIQVGMDSDSLDLVEISYHSEDGKYTQSIIMKPEQAKLVADALNKYLAELELETK